MVAWVQASYCLQTFIDLVLFIFVSAPICMGIKYIYMQYMYFLQRVTDMKQYKKFLGIN